MWLLGSHAQSTEENPQLLPLEAGVLQTLEAPVQCFACNLIHAHVTEQAPSFTACAWNGHKSRILVECAGPTRRYGLKYFGMILAPEGSFHGPAAWEVLLLTLQIKSSPFRNIE